jgi:hypothetical protein
MNHLFYKMLLSIFWLCSQLAFSQNTAKNDVTKKGCTDCAASNYNTKATINDGLCRYKTKHKKARLQSKLDEQVVETSGLIWVNDQLWTINDGGNEASIYKIDTTTGKCTQIIALQGIENIDWEEITASDTHLFIGDFGNNLGNRTDLKIYKISLKDIQNSSNSYIPKDKIETIFFSFNENTDLNHTKPHKTAFDCEAMFFFNGALHVFTKNWVNYRTAHYVLPPNAGTYKVAQKDFFDGKGLITGACISPDKQKMMFIGYKRTGKPFLWQFWDFKGDEFFGGKRQRFKLGSALKMGQTEGITFIDNTNGFISNEKLKIPIFKVPQQLRKFQWIDCEALKR